MPRTLPTISIAPEVLTWARMTAGLSREELAGKVRSGKVDIEEWERSESPILVTGSQLQYIADAVKRPTAALLLNAPPQEQPMPRDFRRPHSRLDWPSSELNRAIRRARRLQRVASSLFEALGERVRSEVPSGFSVSIDPADAALKIRESLNIPQNIHSRWKDNYAALRGWRTIIEDQNVLVLSADFPRDEAQGFSLSHPDPCVIMLSAKDAPTARCFTLWHEFGHLLIRNAGICITDEVWPNDAGDYRNDAGDYRDVEDWCNRFAGAMLVDRDILLSRNQVEAIVQSRTGYETNLRSLANHFKVSQHVVLFRMRHLDLISNARLTQEFSRVNEEQSLEAQTRRSNRSGEVRRNIARQVVRDSGQRFTLALLQAFDRGVVTHSHVADYFGARLKHLENIRREAHR